MRKILFQGENQKYYYYSRTATVSALMNGPMAS